jgi:hypothetical protein
VRLPARAHWRCISQCWRSSIAPRADGASPASSTPLPQQQLPAVPGSASKLYSAAVWLSITQGAASWDALPWCAGEPNNFNGNEGCASLLTVCASPGTAAANDMPSGDALRVMCAVPGECGGGSSPAGGGCRALPWLPCWRLQQLPCTVLGCEGFAAQ